MKPLGLIRYLSVAVVVALAALTFLAPGASAQYGGISGLFVTTSPDQPGFADFSGLGCSGGSEVVLYFPGLGPTSSDPTASQSVPGRILAVTTAVSSDDPLLNGTFSFPNVRLPDVEPGVYEIHARCGGIDLRVLIQIDGNGIITSTPTFRLLSRTRPGAEFPTGFPTDLCHSPVEIQTGCCLSARESWPWESRCSQRLDDSTRCAQDSKPKTLEISLHLGQMTHGLGTVTDWTPCEKRMQPASSLLARVMSDSL